MRVRRIMEDSTDKVSGTLITCGKNIIFEPDSKLKRPMELEDADVVLVENGLLVFGYEVSDPKIKNLLTKKKLEYFRRSISFLAS